ncbi:GAF domain-containing protein [Variovorax sp. KK3]|uniref:GAF domain-containing protein n=1 Tax=Variovorax sp. KK3 TaxID=1855728 RepID=UPI00097CA9A8|nr:GAF domain-containing protein [Variovorax sp. KK3]
MSLHDSDYAPDAFDVKISELLVATSDGSDELIDNSVGEVLRLLREHLKMDVAFVSEFSDGRRVFKRVDTRPEARVIEAGQSSSLEESYCQRVVDGRLPQLIHDVGMLPEARSLPRAPFPIGAHMSTPVVLADGRVYGTICCFSFAPNNDLTQKDLKKLEMSAQLTAKKINERQAQAAAEATANWSLAPQEPLRRR